MTVKDKNTARLTEVCEHSKHGLMMRPGGKRYFTKVHAGGRKNYRKYIEVDPDDIPKHRMKIEKDNEPRMCKGCGKMFKPSEMDGPLCRGFDGCSAEQEIKGLRIESMIPVGGVNCGARLHNRGRA